jgi:hypothetical protein
VFSKGSQGCLVIDEKAETLPFCLPKPTNRRMTNPERPRDIHQRLPSLSLLMRRQRRRPIGAAVAGPGA